MCMVIPSLLHKREQARVWADLNHPEKSGWESCAVEWSQLESKAFYSTVCIQSQKSHVGSVAKNQTPSPVLPQVLCENKRPPSQLENSYFKVEFCASGKNTPKWKSSVSCWHCWREAQGEMYWQIVTGEAQQILALWTTHYVVLGKSLDQLEATAK